MRPTVCFGAGRFTLTQSSRTVTVDCSRKWMSGRAAALAVPRDRGQFGKLICSTTALRDITHKVQRDLRLSIDFYLSWMSLVLLLALAGCYACDCKEPSVQFKRDHYDVIFRGTIVELRDSPNLARIGPGDRKSVV